MFGFTAVILLIYAQFLLGKKSKYAFICGGLGNIIFAFLAIFRQPFQPDLFTISIIFVILSVRNYFLWREDAN